MSVNVQTIIQKINRKFNICRHMWEIHFFYLDRFRWNLYSLNDCWIDMHLMAVNGIQNSVFQKSEYWRHFKIWQAVDGHHSMNKCCSKNSTAKWAHFLSTFSIVSKMIPSANCTQNFNSAPSISVTSRMKIVCVNYFTVPRLIEYIFFRFFPTFPLHIIFGIAFSSIRSFCFTRSDPPGWT